MTAVFQILYTRLDDLERIYDILEKDVKEAVSLISPIRNGHSHNLKVGLIQKRSML
jgi:hypothetical protein